MTLPELEGRILNLRQRSTGLDPDVVRIDRRTKWGNPYRISPEMSRDEALAAYKLSLLNAIVSGVIPLHEIHELAGKRLACWCAPEPCHGEVLAMLADRLEEFASSEVRPRWFEE